MRRFKVGKAQDGQRADVFVAAKFTGFSRSSLERLFESGSVKRARQPLKAGEKLRAGDNLSVDDSGLNISPVEIELPIVYEDKNVVVIDKPAGLLTHSKGALNDEPTVASFIKSKITDKDLTGNRAGIVHRLDRPTSGLIVTARTGQAQQYLQKQFAKRKAKKTYMAIVEGWPEPPEAVIDAPIARNPRKPQSFKVSPGGKAAQTHYRIVERFERGTDKYALLELKPVTGRTHQLRVHLSYIGHPILGDSLYGRGQGNLLLHASQLEITLPGGERRTFESPVPKRIAS